MSASSVVKDLISTSEKRKDTLGTASSWEWILGEMRVDKIPLVEAGIKSLKELDRKVQFPTTLDGLDKVVKKFESIADTTKGIGLLDSLQELNNAIAIDLKNDTTYPFKDFDPLKDLGHAPLSFCRYRKENRSRNRQSISIGYY